MVKMDRLIFEIFNNLSNAMIEAIKNDKLEIVINAGSKKFQFNADIKNNKLSNISCNYEIKSFFDRLINKYKYAENILEGIEGLSMYKQRELLGFHKKTINKIKNYPYDVRLDTFEKYIKVLKNYKKDIKKI